MKDDSEQEGTMIEDTKKKSLGSGSDQKGFIAAMSLALLFALTLIGLSALNTTEEEIGLASTDRDKVAAFYAADGGAEYGYRKLANLLANSISVTQSTLDGLSSPTISGFSFSGARFSITQGASTTGQIASGQFMGLNATDQAFVIVSNPVSSGTGVSAEVDMTVTDHLIPAFQFGLFYENDLELFPGPNMTFAGRVHSNGDLYVGANSTLTFDSVVTSAGNIYHKRKDNGTIPGGNVRIKDGDGVYQNMTFDSTDPNWKAKAIDTWDSNVKDSSHGVTQLAIPIPTGDEAEDIIEPREPDDDATAKSVKYDWKADLRIIDGVAYDNDGFIIDMTYEDPSNPGTYISPLSTRTMYDYRETKWVTVTDIDVSRLIEGGKTPTNRIIYFSNTTANTAVRLVNGSTLPTGGISLASENPAYIKGDYNTVNWQPASVLGDAVTILSNSWNDANSNKPLYKRVATNTTVNAAIATGNTKTTWGNYNGGVENVLRFLEKWSGRTLTYRGSILCLWYSEKATGPWKYGGNNYTAPVRDWGFDSRFLTAANLPPGTPVIRSVEMYKWYRK